MGLIINRQVEITMAEVLEQMEIEPSNRFDTELKVHDGGPVQPEHGFVLHSPVWASWAWALIERSRLWGIKPQRSTLKAQVPPGHSPSKPDRKLPAVTVVTKLPSS